MRRDRIDYLKAFAAFFVVLGHALTQASSDLDPLLNAGNRLIYAFHVPLFLVVSGYLCHAQPFGPYVKKKFRLILVPYFVFALLKLLYNAFVSQSHLHGGSLWECALRYFLLGEAYWFSYCIFFMLLLMVIFWQEGPPVKAMLACGLLTLFDIFRKSVPVALFPASLSVFGVPLTEPLRELDLLLQYFPWMLAGYILRYYAVTLKAFYEKRKVPLLLTAAATVLVFLLLWARGGLAANGALDFLPACAAMLLLYALAEALPEGSALLQEAGGRSYQIMLLDSLFKTLLFALSAKLFGASLWPVLPIAIADVFLCLLSCRLAEKLPPAARLLGIKADPLD